MDNKERLREVRRQQSADRRKIKEQRIRQAERMREVLATKRTAGDIKKHNAIITGIAPRIQGAVDSWCGKRVPMEIEHPAYDFRAWTDFTSIKIMLPGRGDVSIDFIGDLRGLAYHEAGHVLCSIPLPDLVEYCLPLGITREADAYAWRLAYAQRDRYIEKITGVNLASIQRAWNMMEDQRMECAMVSKSPGLANYYNTIVLTHVIHHDSETAWPLICARPHVDRRVVKAARSLFVFEHGTDQANEVQEVVKAYKATNNPHEMWILVCRMARLLKNLRLSSSSMSLDEHESRSMYSDDPSSSEETIEERAQDSATEDSQGVPGAGESQDSEGDESEGDESEEDGGEDEAEDADYGAGSGDSESKRELSEAMNEAAKEAMDEARGRRNADQNLTNDMKAYNDAFRSAGSDVPLPRMYGGYHADPKVRSKAESLNRSLRNIMEQVRAEKAPSWQRQQRNGVVDVIRYKTRQAGDMEFFRNYAEGGDLRLPDLAVSVVLDGSGSMSDHNDDLAACGFAVKSACDVVGIPCTVTVYDSGAHLLYGQEDRPLDPPANAVPGGSTDPYLALQVLDEQRADKDNHLVIIMTDGQWDSSWYTRRSLNTYNAPGRQIVMFYYQCDPYQRIRGVETVEEHHIDELSEIPRYLNRHIMRAL